MVSKRRQGSMTNMDAEEGVQYVGANIFHDWSEIDEVFERLTTITTQSSFEESDLL